MAYLANLIELALPSSSISCTIGLVMLGDKELAFEQAALVVEL